ncbi:EAL domain-containing protein [Altererythrobacter aurantiacus]|uniref:EAL domain-containing protein n=1 Tax=Parapontixanthobacter aurantiacus TaxID=1463599 RepID=A0A844ZD52_9SPHN|nr:EAL domain-containing protein [Parapontixanthobacter aurantiacus]MXO85474.1 EAL domain-containing protein [Parapontixanthobacter aurantiacus]
MGEMPFSALFKKSRNPAELRGGGGRGIEPQEKLSIVEDLEDTGLAAFWATGPDGSLTYLSPSITDGLGKGLDTLKGQQLQNVFKPISSDNDARSLGLKLGTRKAFANFTVSACDRNRDIVLRLSGRPSFDSAGEFQGFRGSGIDITEEFRSEEEANRLAKYDALTGLSNRHRMGQCIDSTLNTFRQAKRTCAILMMDLDRFKAVNDTLGHAAGDQLLVQVAQRLTSVLGEIGEIGRLGGDEFQVMLPDIDDRGKLGEIAKKIITMLSQPYSVEEGRCSIGASVGIAIAPYDGIERDELTRAADLALYSAKNGGRGQFRFYSAELEHGANLRKRMEDDLSDAIDAGQFKLEYQPIVALKGNKVVGLQATYVWDDEERGRVPASTFLPVAEGSRLIVPIGEWALKKACEDACEWPASLRLVMNVSPVQFGEKGFVEMVTRTLEETGLDPARLEIEMNEAVFLTDQAATEKAISDLFKLGVRLSLDQFGTGYTSLSYLRRAPFSSIKIGESFFESTMVDELGDLDMVEAIVELTKVLGMETVAAGVDSLDLLKALAKRGIGNVLGFVFSEPLSSEKIAEEIAAGEWVLDPSHDGSQRAGRRTVFRRIGIIHEDHYYEVTLRNLSRTGAMIEGLEDVPVGTMFVLDFGGGQLAVASVKRTDDDVQGLEFESALVDDGAGGLCTRHRVSPYELAAAGAPLSALPAGKYSGLGDAGGQAAGFPQFKLSGRAPTQGQGPQPV